MTFSYEPFIYRWSYSNSNRKLTKKGLGLDVGVNNNLLGAIHEIGSTNNVILTRCPQITS